MNILSFLNDPNDVCATFLRCLFNLATNFHILYVQIISNVMSTVNVIKKTKAPEVFFSNVTHGLFITLYNITEKSRFRNGFGVMYSHL